MAKQLSALKLRGTLGNLTFYSSTPDGELVRSKSSLTARRFRTDPAFQRSRENNAEFVAASRCVRTFRQATAQLWFNAADNRFTPRVTSHFLKVKDLDSVSARGQRNVAQGFQSAAAKKLFTGFNFNKRAPLQSILHVPCTVNTGTGQVLINSLQPALHIACPEGATHVGLTSAFTIVDFAAAEFSTGCSNPVVLSINDVPVNVALSPASLPSGAGVKFVLLKLSFLQDVNTQLYKINSQTSNALEVLAVA